MKINKGFIAIGFIFCIIFGHTFAYSASITTNDYGCMLSVDIQSDTFLLYEPIMLDISIVNNTNDIVAVNRELIFDTVKIEVYDSKGNKVEMTKRAKRILFSHGSSRLGLKKLYKNIKAKETTCLNYLFDLSLEGTYTANIVAKFRRLNGDSNIHTQMNLTFKFKIISAKHDDVYGVWVKKFAKTYSSALDTKHNIMIYDTIENVAIEKLNTDLTKQDFLNIDNINNTLIGINSRKAVPIFLENIDLKFANRSQTNYPCFDALKEIGLPFSSFTNELNKAESGTKKEKLLHDLGQNLYGDIFPLYLEHFEKNK
jgi:hypothetical protein